MMEWLRKEVWLTQSIQSFPDTGTWRESSTIRQKMENWGKKRNVTEMMSKLPKGKMRD